MREPSSSKKDSTGSRVSARAAEHARQSRLGRREVEGGEAESPRWRKAWPADQRRWARASGHHGSSQAWGKTIQQSYEAQPPKSGVVVGNLGHATRVPAARSAAIWPGPSTAQLVTLLCLGQPEARSRPCLGCHLGSAGGMVRHEISTQAR